MFKKLIFFAIIGGLVYLNYTTPKEEQHRELLLAELQAIGHVPEELHEKIWSQVDYSNFMVCSFIKTSEDSKMISSGYLKKVKIVNKSWAPETHKFLQKFMQDY